MLLVFGLLPSRRLHQVSLCKRNAGDRTSCLFVLFRDAVFGIRNWSSSLETVARYAGSKEPFAVPYLVNSCGFSLGDATILSQNCKFAFDSPERSDSVLNFLKKNGFSVLEIRKIIRTCPSILSSKADSVLSPKVSFFRSVGLSDDDIVEMFSRNPALFTISLKNRLTPWYSLLKSLIEQDAKLNHLLKRSPYMLCLDPQRDVAPKISVLRDTGVSDILILRLLKYQFRAFRLPSAKFNYIVEKVISMDIDPAASIFVNAFEVFQLKKATLNGRVNVYKEFGLSEDEIWSMFKKNPQILKFSQKLIKRKMCFLRYEMGFQLQSVSRYPWVFNYSLEKRIVPRCSVIRVLEEKGLIKLLNPIGPVSALEQGFLERYVEKYLDQIPNLLDIYQGKIRLLECGQRPQM